VGANGGRLRSGLAYVGGNIGSAAGLLLPKCPLCWMAISGSFATAGYAKWGVEIAGIALFLFALWRLLRQSLRRASITLLYLAGAAVILSTGAWISLRWEFRLALWTAVLVACLWMTRLSVSARGSCKVGCSQAS
jgi:hypothetical protein